MPVLLALFFWQRISGKKAKQEIDAPRPGKAGGRGLVA